MLLAIDTCGVVGGVALGEAAPASQGGDAATAGPSTPVGMTTQNEPSTSVGLTNSSVWYREVAGRTFSERLIASVSDLLAEAGVELSRLCGVAVVHGPGSFTGIRIGVSAAKGLAEGLGIPAAGVSRLELLARKADGGSAVAVLDAGRGEFFVGVYRGGIRDWEELLTREAALAAIADSGLPVLVCEERVLAALEVAATMAAAPTAVDALAAGVERFRAGMFADAAELDANYLRRSETEMLARIASHAREKAAGVSGNCAGR
jgi:tRNA threonylcarbamoyladenosine biosynthesis protein TsaB